MATVFGTAINNIGNYVGYPYRLSSGSTLTLTAAHNIPSSAFNGGAFVRVTISRAGVVRTILKATAAPSSTTLTISGTVDGVGDADSENGDIAEARICAGAFTDIHTAINSLENSKGGTIGDPVSGGTANEILYVDSNGHLGQSSSLTFSGGSSGAITLTTTSANALVITTNPSSNGNAILIQRSSDTKNNLLAFQSASLNSTHPLWIMGVASNTVNYAFSSWDGSNYLNYFSLAQSGTSPTIGFYNATPVAKPTVSGSRGGNAALASLMTALSNLGLVTDSTS